MEVFLSNNSRQYQVDNAANSDFSSLGFGTDIYVKAFLELGEQRCDVGSAIPGLRLNGNGRCC